MARAYYPNDRGEYVPWTMDMVGIADPAGAVKAGFSEDNNITSKENYSENQQSFMGSILVKENGGQWWNLISCRHRNNTGDGSQYGMIIYAPLTDVNGALCWNNQAGGTWGAPRQIVDSNNPEVVVSTSQPTNSNAKVWVKI